MKKQTEPAPNLMDFIPTRSLQWETIGEDQVVLLVPKFREGILAKLLNPRISKPNIKVKLDAYGSYFWKLCDGKTTVFGISEKMKEKFGEDFDPHYGRVKSFMTQLIQDKFITITNDSQTNS